MTKNRGRRLRALVFGVGALSLVATVALLLYGSRLGKPAAHEPDSFGRGAISHRAFVETMEALGVPVVRFRSGHYDDVKTPLWFIEPDLTSAHAGSKKFDLRAIIDKRESSQRFTVVVLGKWSESGRRNVFPVSDGDITDVLDAVAPGAGLQVNISDEKAARNAVLRGPLGPVRIEVPSLQSLEPSPELTPLAAAGDRIVVARVKGRHVILVSDPDLLHNFNIQRADHAKLALEIVHRTLASDVVVVDEVFHGHYFVPSLGDALGHYPAMLLPIQAVLLLLLVAIAGFSRSGPDLPSKPTRRAGPAEAVDVGGSVLAIGQPARLLVAGYVEQLLDDMADKRGIREADPRMRAQRIDDAARRRNIEPRAAWLLSEATRIESSRTGLASALAVARAAWSFRRQLTERASADNHRKAA